MLDKKLIAKVAVNAHLFDTGNKKLLFAGNDDNRLVRWNVANGTVRKLPRSSSFHHLSARGMNRLCGQRTKKQVEECSDVAS